MGSLNFDGSVKTQPNISKAIRHQGDFLRTTDTETDSSLGTTSNSGAIDFGPGPFGVAWQSSGTASTSGLGLAERRADNSVERAKFTANGQEAGNIQHFVTRKINGIQVSVSNRQAITDPVAANISGSLGLIGADALGPMSTVSERKVFFLQGDRNSSSPAAWKIFDNSGEAVGPGTGTTDVDSTANEKLLGNS